MEESNKFEIRESMNKIRIIEIENSRLKSENEQLQLIVQNKNDQIEIQNQIKNKKDEKLRKGIHKEEKEQILIDKNEELERKYKAVR